MTRYITKEVQAEDTLSIDDESNQLAFVAGVVVAFLIMAIVILICYFVYRRHQKRSNKIVIRQGLSPDVDINSGAPNRDNRIIMQDVQVSEIGGLAAGVVGTPGDNDHSLHH